MKSAKAFGKSPSTTSGPKKKVSKGKPKKGGGVDDGNKRMRAFTKPLAEEALEFYNQQARTNYVVVEDGHMKCETKLLKNCLVYHLNFVAKKKDICDCEEEMFFAEVTSRSGVHTVEFCVTLGSINSSSLPEISNHGCHYCRAECFVRHPKAEGWFKFY